MDERRRRRDFGFCLNGVPCFKQHQVVQPKLGGSAAFGLGADNDAGSLLPELLDNLFETVPLFAFFNFARDA